MQDAVTDAGNNVRALKVSRACVEPPSPPNKKKQKKYF